MEDKSDNGELDLDGIDEEEIEKVCSLLFMDKVLYLLHLHCFCLVKISFCLVIRHKFYKMLLDLCLKMCL